MKNQYATIPNDEKTRLLNETFSGPLRALRNFFDFIGNDHEALIMEIERFIAKHDMNISDEKRKKLARNAVLLLIVEISFGGIYKTASSVGSEHLQEAISSIVEANDIEAYRLIDLAIKLKSQKGIPFKLIKNLTERTKNNAFAFRILQRIALNHLYMFKTSEADKQKLCVHLDIPIKTQRIIDLQTKDTKLVR